MPELPAFCDKCGTAFRSGFAFDNATNITLSGNKSGPCPKCGGTGHVPDGVFNFIGSTIEILSAPERTVNELTRLMQIIREAKEKQQTPETVATQIKTELPALSRLADLLPRNRGELYAFLAVIISAVQLLSDSPKPSQNITINVSQVVERWSPQFGRGPAFGAAAHCVAWLGQVSVGVYWQRYANTLRESKFRATVFDRHTPLPQNPASMKLYGFAGKPMHLEELSFKVGRRPGLDIYWQTVPAIGLVQLRSPVRFSKR